MWQDLQVAFGKAVVAAKLGRRVVPYDLRGIFCTHRAMVVKSFRQLQSEMGHLDPKSLENYLAEASKCDPRESRTIYQWVHEGYIPVIKLGALVRFDKASIIEWVKKREAPGRAKQRVELDVR